jgi:hypothetical protein
VGLIDQHACTKRLGREEFELLVYGEANADCAGVVEQRAEPIEAGELRLIGEFVESQRYA